MLESPIAGAQIEVGLTGLARKARTLLLIFLAVPAIILVRAVRPVILVRFKSLRSKTIGHFAANTELYLCERDLNVSGRRTFDIFYMPQPASNVQLEKMWRRTIRVSLFANELLRVSRRFPGHEAHEIPRQVDRDPSNLLARTKPHLSFTAEEERSGQAALRAIGIPEGAPFMCFHSRDSAYLDTMLPGKYGNMHDYRDSAISDYVPAAEEMVRRGYFALRMGAVVKEPLESAEPRVIDYAARYRTDFLDMYILAKCRFFLCSNSGVSAIPELFRRPAAFANFIPLEFAPTWGAKDLFIPKNLWLGQEHRFMTFREIVSTRREGVSVASVGLLSESNNYETLGIEPVQNTPEEVAALAVEMDERLKGTWQTTEEDEELQRRFWCVFKESESFSHFHGDVMSRIGADFLRQNQELLD